jgi:putative NADH-flavin reductase
LRPGAVLPAELAGAQAREVDILDAQALAEAVRGHDAVASAYGPAMDAPQETVAVMQALMAACRASAVRRLVVVVAGLLLVLAMTLVGKLTPAKQ